MTSVSYEYTATPEFDAWLADNGPLDVSHYVAELESAERDGLSERKIDDYDAKTEADIWRQTKERSEQPRRFIYFGEWPNRPALSFHIQRKLLSRILRKHRKCKAVVDFGTLYAKPDADIAREFPDVAVYGVDRSENIKKMNEDAFPDIPNLHFAAADILSFLKDRNEQVGLLVHALTGICLLPGALRSLYAQCANSRVQHMVLIEFAGYSHQLKRRFEFGDTLSPSVVYRQSMLLHDYPNMLRAAGYEIVEARLVKSPMPKPVQQDAHLLVLHAALPQ